MWTRRVLWVTVFLAWYSGYAYSQCQDQTCAVNQSGCFACQGATGFSCAPSGCDTCTIKLCSGGSGGGHQGPRCQNIPDHLPGGRLVGVESLKQQAKLGMEAQPSSNALPGFTFAPISVPNSPAQIASITIDKKKAVIQDASVLNIGEKKITAYQIGWVAGTSPADAEVTVSPTFEVPIGIEPGAEVRVPAQPFPNSKVKSGVRVAFFVASVRFQDGTTWSSDLKELRKKALSDDVKSSSGSTKHVQL